MSGPITVSSLTKVKPRDLSQQMLESQDPPKFAVVDVRDSDYLGGHIKGSIHAPCDQLEARIPELLRVLADKERVIFHCMLSQQRGPSAALAYARARAADVAKRSKEDPDNEATGNRDKTGGQTICVLEGGFNAWQQSFGNDKNLTEGYVKELWDAELI